MRGIGKETEKKAKKSQWPNFSMRGRERDGEKERATERDREKERARERLK